MQALYSGVHVACVSQIKQASTVTLCQWKEKAIVRSNIIQDIAL